MEKLLIKRESLKIADISDTKTIGECIKKSQPCIIKTDIGTVPDFHEKVGHVRTNIYWADKGEGSSITDNLGTHEPISFSTYFQEGYLENNWAISYDFQDNKEFMSALKELTDLHPELDALVNGFFGNLFSISYWVSPKGHFTNLHYDAVENFNLQLTGRKTFLISPPRLKNYHAGKILKFRHFVSDIRDITNYEQSRFPRFSSNLNNFYLVELQAGDILYLPCCWWHQVETSDDGYASNINWWFLNLKKALRYPTQAIASILLQLHRSQKKWRARSRRKRVKKS